MNRRAREVLFYSVFMGMILTCLSTLIGIGFIIFFPFSMFFVAGSAVFAWALYNKLI